jgi:Glycosyl transferases group 1
MTVLHIGFPNPSIYRACQRRHHQYSYIDSSGITAPTTAFDAAVLDKYDSEYCDSVFIHAHADCLSSDCLSALKDRGASIMHFTWDVFDPLPDFFLRYAPYCLTAFTNKTDVDTLTNMGFESEYLPYGFNDSVFTPYGVVSPEGFGTIVFMCNDHEDRYPLGELRREVVKLLESKYSGFRVYGHGWGRGVSNYAFRPSMEAEAYRSCVCAINLSSYDRPGYSSDRLLRAMGSGACVVSKAIPGGHLPGMSDGQNYLEWTDLRSLVERVDYALNNRVNAAVIGKRAAEYAHSSCRFDKVVERMETQRR